MRPNVTVSDEVVVVVGSPFARRQVFRLTDGRTPHHTVDWIEMHTNTDGTPDWSLSVEQGETARICMPRTGVTAIKSQ